MIDKIYLGKYSLTARPSNAAVLLLKIHRLLLLQRNVYVGEWLCIGHAVLCVLSSVAIILPMKTELFALLQLCICCCVAVIGLCLILMVPWVRL